MPRISSTRTALLTRRAQIRLAEHGRDLLEQKRAALMETLLRDADSLLRESQSLNDAASTARQALARAYAVAGQEAVLSAALASRDELPLRIGSSNVMGVRVPSIEQARVARSAQDRGYAIAGASITLEEAATDFETEVDLIIQLAESELRLRRLVEELQRTARRVNALENLLIPQLKAETQHIQTTLDERERADRFRLKLAKRVLERKRGRNTRQETEYSTESMG